ncbi:ABC1 kinase family protein [Sandaracinus amylolyticus]|uniref:Ubiquinone biosynthesis monooxygenase UbiB n=1 Tax=Sandaracinus amylolyticus TaxID=927083 RepID=A0A0F6SES2_9BACT|nr:AarF/ABC1/UbiB kinase family protein [Sandaracinus amylolyticus]AKF05689.1 Ubiquinone biosynthesis monooxygenase UbiB [Sandaracinus amylolyticus]
MAPPTLLSAVRDLDRLRQIVAVLVRHGFGEIVARTSLGSLVVGKSEARNNQSVGERVRLVIQDLGPSFVKLGQIVSTRPDLIPPEVITELKKLQDRVPPVAYEAIKEQIESDLGSPLEQIFESFDAVPLASASVGQVHRAQLRTSDGQLRQVAVKVQRPGIKTVIERDVELLYILAQAVERSIPDARIYSPVKLVSEFDRAITAELDFGLEADHAIRFAKNFEGHPEVRFPKIYREASGKRVLALEFFEGRKVYDAVAQGFDPEKITRATLGIIIKSIFEDGFFHADPHPGNVILMGVADAPVIGLIDLGLVGRLTPQLRDKTIDLMVAAVQEDYRGIADALYAIGTPTRKVDRQAFEAEVAMLAEKYLGKKLADIQVSALIRDLVQGATKYGIEIPPDFLMVGKAIMTVEGVGKEIAPHFDLYEEMKPYFLRLLANRYSPERMLPELLRSVARISSAATEFPMQAQEILEDLRRGRLEVRVREPSLTQAFDVIGRRIYSGFVVGSLVMGSAWLASAGSWTASGLFFVMALAWGGAHTVLAMWLSRKKRP